MQFLSGGNFPERLMSLLFIRWTFGPEQDSGGATFKAFNDMFSSDFRWAFRPGRDPGEWYLICKCLC